MGDVTYKGKWKEKGEDVPVLCGPYQKHTAMLYRPVNERFALNTVKETKLSVMSLGLLQAKT